MKTQDPIAVELGNIISVSRKLQGYNQEEFSQLIGISTRALSKIENGYNLPSLTTASMIDSFLDINILDLLRSFNYNPELKISILYNEYNISLHNRDNSKLIEIYQETESLSNKVSRNSIHYKKYLLIKSWHYINSSNIINAYEALNVAYNIHIANSEENKIIDHKIYLLKESIAPDLENSLEDIEKIANLSFNNLIKRTSKLESYPDIKMKYLYNALIIKLENLEDYSINNTIMNPLLQTALELNNYTIYFQTVFYRGMIKYYNANSNFYLDLDEALTYFYIKQNYTFFDSNVNLLKENILIDYFKE